MTMIDLAPLGDLCAKFLLAVVFGGAIGYERELNGKFAGLRTHALICLGAALIMHLSYVAAGVGTGHQLGDPARMGAQVVAGVGFLGAGAILQSRGRIIGLTTAATIWVVAAVGLSLGGGYLVEASITTIFVWVVLVLPAFWERKVVRRKATKLSEAQRQGYYAQIVKNKKHGSARDVGRIKNRLKRFGSLSARAEEENSSQDLPD